ncbi:MAG: hypothetical protein Q9157_003794 [Trypethelium eluteriae]
MNLVGRIEYREIALRLPVVVVEVVEEVEEEVQELAQNANIVAIPRFELSFAEIAKLVGERWQQLAPEEREPFERKATTAKEKYYSQLAEYKKTSHYKEYQDYVADFRAKYPAQPAEGKRSKLETETSTSTRSSSHEISERSRRRFSAGTETLVERYPRAGSSPPTAMHPHHSTSSYPTSPATQNFGTQQSPAGHGEHSPISVSPISSSQQSRGPFSGLLHTREHRLDRMNNPQQNAPSQIPYSFLRSESTGSRSNRDSPSIPPLMHEETTLSSESSHTSVPYQAAQLPQTEVLKPHPHRLLPAPVPTPGAVLSPLDATRPPLPVPFTTASQDPRQPNPLAALLRAGELARESESRADESNTTKDTSDRPP